MSMSTVSLARPHPNRGARRSHTTGSERTVFLTSLGQSRTCGLVNSVITVLGFTSLFLAKLLIMLEKECRRIAREILTVKVPGKAARMRCYQLLCLLH